MIDVITHYNELIESVEDKQIDGLKFVPTFGDKNDDKDSIIKVSYGKIGHGYTQCVRDVILGEMTRLGEGGLKCIVEIGVHCSSQRPPVCEHCGRRMASYTEMLIESKYPPTFYIGIDKDEKKRFNDKDNRVYTIQMNSSHRGIAFDFLDELEIEKIDLLHIDGWHSVNQIIMDWQYTERLSDHGVVIIHDVNYYPGPWAIYEAVDGRMYYKRRACPDDWGCAVMRRIPK